MFWNKYYRILTRSQRWPPQLLVIELDGKRSAPPAPWLFHNLSASPAPDISPSSHDLPIGAWTWFLVTNDQAFRRIKKLKVEDWAKPKPKHAAFERASRHNVVHRVLHTIPTQGAPFRPFRAPLLLLCFRLSQGAQGPFAVTARDRAIAPKRLFTCALLKIEFRLPIELGIPWASIFTPLATLYISSKNCPSSTRVASSRFWLAECPLNPEPRSSSPVFGDPRAVQLVYAPLRSRSNPRLAQALYHLVVTRSANP